MDPTLCLVLDLAFRCVFVVGTLRSFLPSTDSLLLRRHKWDVADSTFLYFLLRGRKGPASRGPRVAVSSCAAPALQPPPPRIAQCRNHSQGGCIRHDRRGDAQRLATQTNSTSREHRTTPRTRTARATPATRRHRARTTPAAPSAHSARQAKRRPQNAAGTAHETTA